MRKLAIARGKGRPFHAGKSVCKGPKERKHLVFTRAEREAHVAGAQ